MAQQALASACCALALLFSAAGWALENRLIDHPSPYLALHGADPVAWQTWNARTIALARQQHKLIYVSIGYFSCHWCHVMQQESYRNPDIAALLNRNFIPVKVDRELETGLDGYLQDFAERTRGQAGWPLNVFLTPEGYPLLAVLYLPPQDFLGVLTQLSTRWGQQAPQLSALARAFTSKARPVRAEPINAGLRDGLEQLFNNEVMARADLFQGGFGPVNKFPMAPQLDALLAIQARQPRDATRSFLTLTLDQMMRLGLYDAVGGGFFRYTTDPDWHTPHFEKMLYDNAQLAMLYLRAADVFKRRAYRDTAHATLDFMAAILQDPKTGGLVSSASAIDDQKREGATYLWQRSELQRLLTADELRAVEKTWRLDLPADSAYGYLPMQRVQPDSNALSILSGAYRKLAQARAKRSLPLDSKQVAGLNGLALSAFSRAAAMAPRHAVSAAKVRNFLVNQLLQQGRLAKAYAAGHKLGAGELEDYVYVAAGLADYADFTGHRDDRAMALALLRTTWKRFFSAAGWKTQEASLLPGMRVQAALADGAMPSAAAQLIAVSLASGDRGLRKQALQALSLGLPDTRQAVFWHASYLAALNSAVAQSGRR